MASALAVNSHRNIGPTHTLKFAQRPLCIHCGAEMVVRHSSKPKVLIDLEHNIQIITYYYRCNDEGCVGMKEKYVRPENPFAPIKSDYSYKVYAKICHIRWSKHRTYQEIVEDMNDFYDIHLTANTVEFALKIYEIGCAEKYRPGFIEEIQKNGGIILTIDGMAPMKGNKSLYVVYDYLTGLTIGSWRIPNQKADTIELFLSQIKTRIEEILGVSVLGIVSDALPSQRIAIKRVLPDVPHCLCHYHFYALVLNDAKKVDSNMMTQIRKKLRVLYDLKKFIERKNKNLKPIVSCRFLEEILSLLEALSNWKRHPKDPCFSGLVLYSRVHDLYLLLEQAINKLDSGSIQCEDDKPVRRLFLKLSEIIEEYKEKAKDLSNIQDHLSELSSILGDLDIDFDNGLKTLRKFRDKLRKNRFSSKCGETERTFIEALMKFVRTKGDMLFNYKRVDGAPTTNNRHELKYKQLKHFLRRVIGFASAKRYLLTHGERIVFVRIDESLEEILEIFRATDIVRARDIIRRERCPRTSLPYVIHYHQDWNQKLERITIFLAELEVPLIIIN